MFVPIFTLILAAIGIATLGSVLGRSLLEDTVNKRYSLAHEKSNTALRNRIDQLQKEHREELDLTKGGLVGMEKNLKQREANVQRVEREQQVAKYVYEQLMEAEIEKCRAYYTSLLRPIFKVDFEVRDAATGNLQDLVQLFKPGTILTVKDNHYTVMGINETDVTNSFDMPVFTTYSDYDTKKLVGIMQSNALTDHKTSLTSKSLGHDHPPLVKTEKLVRVQNDEAHARATGYYPGGKFSNGRD